MAKSDKWKEFELLTKSIQESIAGDAVVTHNEKIMGKSGVKRQVDVTVRGNIGQFPILIALDCKDYKHPLDIKDIETCAGLFEDIRANKGVVVAFKGYTPAAKNKAEEKGIELYTLIDAQNANWKIKVSVPVVYELMRMEYYSLQLSGTGFLVISELNPTTTLYDENKNSLGTVEEKMRELVSSGKIESRVGESTYTLPNIYLRYEDNYYRVDLTYEYSFKKEIYLGQVPVSELRGFKVESTGAVITNKITLSGIILNDVINTWKLVDNVENIEPKPFMTMGGILI